MIGLGAMGSAIAQRCLSGGLSMTVWNRTPNKAVELGRNGAKVAKSLAEAVQASRTIAICVMDYAATKVLLEQPGIAASLRGRTIIQFTSGTPSEAAELANWCAAHGAQYLDAAIMCYPGDLGTDRAQVLVAGESTANDDAKPILSQLAHDLRYVGANARAAKTLDLALLTRLVGMKFCTMHGALICESEGVDLSHLADLLPDGENTQRMVETVASDDFAVRGGSASVNVAAAAFAAMQAQASARGISSELPDLFQSWCNAGRAKGWADLDNAVLIKVLRS
jgi:3-hydroxyisobutyrate dehydrogenase-like beta-hydroxyacid dehydrogenase